MTDNVQVTQQSQTEVDALLAKADKAHSPTNPQEPPQPTPPPEPKGKLAGKYESPEKLEEGYKNLNAEYQRTLAELAKLKGDKTAEPTAEEKAAAEKAAADKAAEEAKNAPLDIQRAIESPEEAAKQLTAKGLDIAQLQASFDANGKLTDADYTALEKAGITRAVADQYVEGVKAKAQVAITQVFEAAGGETAFRSMQAWASRNFTDGELAAYNDGVQAGGDKAKLAVAALRSRFEGANGREPSLVKGNVAANTSETYTSKSEMTRDMSDPRYSKDPAFRAAVAGKLANAKF